MAVEEAPTAPSADAKRAKRNGAIAEVLAVVLVLSLAGMHQYLTKYRPAQQKAELWRQAQVLGRPSHWEGNQGVHHNGPIATGTYFAIVGPDIDPDPVESMWRWTRNLDIAVAPQDAEALRKRCFGRTSCHFAFEYAEFTGWLLIYPREPTSKGVRYEARYEMWWPAVT